MLLLLLGTGMTTGCCCMLLLLLGIKACPCVTRVSMQDSFAVLLSCQVSVIRCTIIADWNIKPTYVRLQFHKSPCLPCWGIITSGPTSTVTSPDQNLPTTVWL